MPFLSARLSAGGAALDGTSFFVEAIRRWWFMRVGRVLLERSKLGPEFLNFLAQDNNDLK
jgi:hypothetical protein